MRLSLTWSAIAVPAGIRSTAGRRSQLLRSAPTLRRQHTSSQGSHLPRFAQPSIWQSIVPKALRNRVSGTGKATKKKTNPASYFIWIYLLIGSQAIRIMGVKHDFSDYTRKADLKLEKLRQVIEKLHRGEQVDVEKVLGTGDAIQEQEWEDALRELQEEDRVWQNNAKKTREERDRAAEEAQDANPINDGSDTTRGSDAARGSHQPVGPRSPGFY